MREVEAQCEEALARLRAAFPAPLKIVETTPKKGGFRTKIAKILIARGLAEWLVEEQYVRLKP